MAGPGRIPPRGGKTEIETGKGEGIARPVDTKLSPLVSSGIEGPKISEAQTKAEFERRFGEAEDKPFFIGVGRIRSAVELIVPAPQGPMPFRTLVHRNDLYGGRVLSMDFQKQAPRYTLGARKVLGRHYVNEHKAPGQIDQSLVSREGHLHLRNRVMEDMTPRPDFMDLSRNEAIETKQAELEERQGVLVLRNPSRARLVWILEGSQWRAVEPYQEATLKDGAWIILGPDPNKIEDHTIDTRVHTVLKVEYHRLQALKPDHRWNLIEFERRDPASLEKISEPQNYLAALLGQSPNFIAWRFRPLLEALKDGAWQAPDARALLHHIFSESPVLAELKFGMLASVLVSAQKSGWSKEQLSALLLHESMARRNVVGLLGQLPKFLEATSGLGIDPGELGQLLTRIVKHDPNFTRTMEALPGLLREWNVASGGSLRLRELVDFLDRSEVTIDLLAKLFAVIPGGRGFFLETMAKVIPELQDRYGFRASTLTEIGAEILTGIAENALAPSPSPSDWIPAVLQSLPLAFVRLFELGFGVIEQRQILRGLSAEKGFDFAGWWQHDQPLPRRFWEDYLSLLPQENLDGRP